MRHETLIHYNNDPVFFSEFLDPYLKYGSGLFADDSSDFETAAVRMLDHSISLAQINANDRILDIGCGWGSLYKRLIEKRPVNSYIGLTPSSEQISYIRRNINADCHLIEVDFENCILEDQFDVVFLNDSFCHLKEKQTQFQRISSLLKPNGRATYKSFPTFDNTGTFDFFQTLQ